MDKRRASASLPTPDLATPARARPAHATPTHATPAHATQAHDTPTHPTPTHGTPALPAWREVDITSLPPTPGEDSRRREDDQDGGAGADLVAALRAWRGAPADPGGLVVAVWGPAGAPGRSVVAAGLADAAAAAGAPTVLVDADPYGGSQAVRHGLLDESSGLLRATRLADRGRLDAAHLARCVATLRGGLGLLTGLPDSASWPRLRPAALEVVLQACRVATPLTVVDCGFCLEEDEELSYDTDAPRRNGATLTALRAADLVVAVGACDPVGIARLRTELPVLADLLPEPLPVVLNRTGPGSRQTWAREAEAALRAQAAVGAVHRLPDDPSALEAQLVARVPLREAAPDSVLAAGCADLVQRLLRRQPVTGAHA